MIIITVAIFLIVLGVLVFVHELGHFLMARAFGTRVDEFAIGFGPKIWSRLGTEKNGIRILYSLRAIPFGGYVKIYGENGEDGPVSADSFVNKNRFKQVVVLAAGIFFNFIFAWFVISFVFMIGAPVSPDSYTQYASRIQNQHVIVDDVVIGSPAEKAGLKAETVITSVGPVGGNQIEHPSVQQIQNTVNTGAGKPVLINGISVTPVTGIVPGASSTYAIGIDMEDAGTLRLPPLNAIWEGAKFTVFIMQETIQGVWGLIVGLFHHDTATLSQVSGVVGIYGYVRDAVQVGFIHLLMLVAVISVNLGVLNLVPFPGLDGSRILVVGIEAVIRRPLKASVMSVIYTGGFCALILLSLFIAYHDIATRL